MSKSEKGWAGPGRGTAWVEAQGGRARSHRERMVSETAEDGERERTEVRQQANRGWGFGSCA